MRKLLVPITFLLLLAGCATPYTGPRPNLEARGEGARAEYERLRIQEDFFDQEPEAFKLGPNERLTTRKSFEPILSEISPRARDRLRTADTWRAVQLGFLGVMIGTLLVSVADHPTYLSTGAEVLFYGSAAASLSCGIVSSAQMSKAAAEYNEDLRRKLGLEPAPDRQARLYPQLQFSLSL